MKSKNEKVQHFLDGTMMSDAEKYKSLMEMRKMVFDTYPDTTEKFMYGGIIFSHGDEHFSGVFVRTNHISFEFSNGFKMKDPDNILEGGGKFRRHLKIRTYEDIQNKAVSFFVKQALGQD